MDEIGDVFIFEVVRWNSLEFVPREHNRSQVRQLLYYAKVLVPAVKQVVIEIQVHGSWDALLDSIFRT